MALGSNSNKQLETQLLSEWWNTLPRHWPNKTHVNVGRALLDDNGQPPTPARQRALGVWNDWADMRIFTGAEVWLVEGTIVNTGGKYGQLIDYLDEYPTSLDYDQFRPAPVVGIVVCAFERRRTAVLYARWNIRTVLFTPAWARNSLDTKVFTAHGVG